MDTIGWTALPFDMNWNERSHVNYIQFRVLRQVARSEYKRFVRVYARKPLPQDERFLLAATRLKLRGAGLGGCVWLLDQGIICGGGTLGGAIEWLKDVWARKYDAAPVGTY